MAQACPSCGGEVEAASLACPACGSPRGVFATLQRALATLTLVGFMVLWYAQTPLSGGQSTPTDLLEPGAEPGNVFVAVVVAIVVGVLGSLLVFGPRLVVGARLALRPSKASRPGRVLFAQFLVAWVVAMFLEALVGSMFMVPLELVQGQATYTFGAGGVAFEAPSKEVPPNSLHRISDGWAVRGGSKRIDRIEIGALTSGTQTAQLRWRMGSAELKLAEPAGVASDALIFAVAGRPVEGTRVTIAPGEALQVGDFEATVRGPGWTQLVRGVAVGKTVALLLLIVGCVGLGGRELFEELGVTGAGGAREAGRGAVALFAFVPCYVVLVITTQLVGVGLGIPVESHPLVHAILDRSGAELVSLVVLQAVVLAPILEELVFRGFLLSAGARALGRPAGLVLSALAFAFVHAGFASLFPMFGLGLLFGLLRLASPTGSLVGPITAHALFNGVSLTLLFAASA